MCPDNTEPAKIGLREKKKLKTRQTLQRQGLRLIREQGYNATTIEQIAEASEISPSTFFRYFATKEALVLEDDYDPVLIDLFQKQPLDLSPIQAFRAAVREGFTAMSDEEKEVLTGRIKLMLAVPELRSASLMQMNENLRMIASLLADRLQCAHDNFEVHLFAGSLLGAMMAVQLHCILHPEADFYTLVDQALSMLEAGLPLGELGKLGTTGTTGTTGK